MGGWHFIQRVVPRNNVFTGDVAARLELFLTESMKSLEAEDTTIKICGDHFHVFSHIRGRYAPITFINAARLAANYVLQESEIKEKLDEEYLLTGAYDLDVSCVNRDLKNSCFTPLTSASG